MAINIVTPKAPMAPALPPGIAPAFALVQEKFPKVGEKIAKMWGSVVLQEYLSKTIFDERGGRQGFPMPVVSALMLLHEYHSTLIPEVSSGDTWDEAK
ncbi:MAG: hypothetical protein HZB47_01800 [Nitrosomonadales bacterium]|nr:hypothetical protein [Nitrosomonadales bacterium]